MIHVQHAGKNYPKYSLDTHACMPDHAKAILLDTFCHDSVFVNVYKNICAYG